MQCFFAPAAKNVARPKSRGALRPTSLAEIVAQNIYFDPNVAPAQQRNSQLMPCHQQNLFHVVKRHALIEIKAASTSFHCEAMPVSAKTWCYTSWLYAQLGGGGYITCIRTTSAKSHQHQMYA